MHVVILVPRRPARGLGHDPRVVGLARLSLHEAARRLVDESRDGAVRGALLMVIERGENVVELMRHASLRWKVVDSSMPPGAPTSVIVGTPATSLRFISFL